MCIEHNCVYYGFDFEKGEYGCLYRISRECDDPDSPPCETEEESAYKK